MTAEEAFYCTILYHAKNKTEGNELLHAICKCIIDDAERLQASNMSFENALNMVSGKPAIKVEAPISKEIKVEAEEPAIESFSEELRTLPDELVI